MAGEERGEDLVHRFAADLLLDVLGVQHAAQPLDLATDLAEVEGADHLLVFLYEPQTAQRHRVLRIGAVDDYALRGELGEHQVDDGTIEIAPAEEIVAVVPDDAQHAIARLQE